MMIVQVLGEKRIDYLARVLHSFMHDTAAGSQTIDFDETTCDGHCLADDFAAELGLDSSDF